MITLEKVSKAFRLSDTCGPTHEALAVQIMIQGSALAYVVLKKSEFVMYPPKKYGTVTTRYSVYALYGDESYYGSTWVCTLKNLREVAAYVRECKAEGCRVIK
jgi:hypothetical protein